MIKKFEKKLEELFEKSGVAGFTAGVTDRRGEIYSCGLGTGSAERPELALTADYLHRIASITKTVTGSLIFKLTECGLLDLNTPVKEYLPWLKLSDSKATEQLTLWHLLSHKSGLPAEYNPDGPREESALEQSLKDELPKIPLLSLPNDKKYCYSNWGIRIAAMCAQAVTGKMYTDLAKEYILDPLGMNETTYDLHTAATYPLSLPHKKNDDGTYSVVHHLEENAARYATGGLYSNVHDLLKLCRYFLNNGKADSGERILSEESLNKMRTPLSDTPVENSFYCMTTIMRKYAGRQLFGHTGAAHPYTSALFYDLQSGYGVVCLVNTLSETLNYDVVKAFFDCL